MRRYIVLPYTDKPVTEYEKQKWLSKGITYKEGKII